MDPGLHYGKVPTFAFVIYLYLHNERFGSTLIYYKLSSQTEKGACLLFTFWL